MKKYVCAVCGYVHEGNEPPEKCPQCGAPKEKFHEAKQQSTQWADEHRIGVAQGVDAEVYEGLKANFNGECTEIGMYMAMSRQADREGYPEVAEAYRGLHLRKPSMLQSLLNFWERLYMPIQKRILH